MIARHALMITTLKFVGVHGLSDNDDVKESDVDMERCSDEHLQ